jgi:hypothetical protein
MSEMVERARDALRAECIEVFGSNWSNDIAERFARVVMASMRMPTLDVLTAAYNSEPIPSMRADMPHYFRAWRAGIDEALK